MIRSANAADANEIAALMHRIVDETTITFTTVPPTAAELADAIARHRARGDAYVVAVDAGFLGFANYGPFRAGPGYSQTAEISIYVTATAQGRGIGRKLLETLENHARRNGIHCLIAGISAENTQAVAFHAKSGFAQVGHLPEVGHKFGRYLDLVLMQKTL